MGATPPAEVSIWLIVVKSFLIGYAPALATAPSIYTFPAGGTYTTSPGCHNYIHTGISI